MIAPARLSWLPKPLEPRSSTVEPVREATTFMTRVAALTTPAVAVCWKETRLKAQRCGLWMWGDA
jgi:hypothetical protein